MWNIILFSSFWILSKFLFLRALRSNASWGAVWVVLTIQFVTCGLNSFRRSSLVVPPSRNYLTITASRCLQKWSHPESNTFLNQIPKRGIFGFLRTESICLQTRNTVRTQCRIPLGSTLPSIKFRLPYDIPAPAKPLFRSQDFIDKPAEINMDDFPLRTISV